MIRTQIQLPVTEYERLRAEAQRQGRSMADCIRQGIGLYLASATADTAELLALAGRFSPRDSSDLKPHDASWIAEIRPARDR